jgi:hypothetical protein
MSDTPVQLGHYRLGKTLGIGSFGKVKRTCGLPPPALFQGGPHALVLL